MTMERRYNCWYAYLAVPVDVRDALGKRRFYKSLETDRKDLATIRHLQYIAEWKELIRVARLGIPDYLVKANSLAITDTKYNPEDIAILIDAKGEDAATEFVKIATGQDIIFEPNIKKFLENIKCVDDSLGQHERDITYFCEHFDKLSSVNTKAIRKWITQQREIRTDNAIKRILRIAKKFLKYIEFKFNVVIEVDLTVPNFEKVESEEIDRTEIPDEDLLKIYNVSDPQLKDLILLLAFTGARIDDLSHLRVKHILEDPESKVKYFDITKSKNKAGIRKLPIHNKILGVVDRLTSNKDPDDYLLPCGAKDRASSFSQAFSKVKIELGYDKTISAHSIRHAVNSKLYRLKLSELDVCQVLGHAYKGKSEGKRTYYHGQHLLELSKIVNMISWYGLGPVNILKFDE